MPLGNDHGATVYITFFTRDLPEEIPLRKCRKFKANTIQFILCTHTPFVKCIHVTENITFFIIFVVMGNFQVIMKVARTNLCPEIPPDSRKALLRDSSGVLYEMPLYVQDYLDFYRPEILPVVVEGKRAYVRHFWSYFTWH